MSCIIGNKRKRSNDFVVKHPHQKKRKINEFPTSKKDLELFFNHSADEIEVDEIFRMMCCRDHNIALLHYLWTETGRPWLTRVNALSVLSTAVKVKRMKILYEELTTGDRFQEIFHFWGCYLYTQGHERKVQLPRSLTPKSKKKKTKGKQVECEYCEEMVLDDEILNNGHECSHCQRCAKDPYSCCICYGDGFDTRYGCDCPDCLQFRNCLGCKRPICDVCCDCYGKFKKCSKCKKKKGYWCEGCQKGQVSEKSGKPRLLCSDCCGE